MDEDSAAASAPSTGQIVSGEGENYSSGTVALAWLKPDRFKATTRYDGSDRGGYSGVLSAGVAARLHGGLTGLVRTEWLESEGAAASGTSVGVLAALALRPVTNDRAGVLLSYQYLDRDAALRSFGAATPGAAWRHRLSTDGYLQPLRWLSLHGKVGWEQLPSGTTEAVSTYLGQGRAQFSLFRYVDAAIEERYIRQPSTDSTRRSTGAEIGVWPIADLRVALGYHFQDTRDPFGRDLQGAAKGFYGTVSTKLSRLFNLMGSTPPQ